MVKRMEVGEKGVLYWWGFEGVGEEEKEWSEEEGKVVGREKRERRGEREEEEEQGKG